VPGAGELTHPRAPWVLAGRALILPAWTAQRAGRHGARTVAGPGGRSLGGLVLGRYEAGSTLRYTELLGVGGLLAGRAGAGFWIPFARVDGQASLAGGRSIWDIPKELARFEWLESAAGTTVAVIDADGGVIVRIRAAGRVPSVPLPVLAPFVGLRGGRRGLASGFFTGRPARVSVHLPELSPLHELGLSFSPIGLLGRTRLRVDALASAVRP
jgi:acetoacetate decarboxylase